jgi:hypothetical protein
MLGFFEGKCNKSMNVVYHPRLSLLVLYVLGFDYFLG